MLMLPCCHTIQFLYGRMKIIPNDIFFAQIESQLAAGRSVSFKVKGNSMFPFLRNGKDSVHVSPLKRQPVAGDVVLFKYKGHHVLHRIIKIEGDIHVIQGDGIYASQECCGKEDIVGVVTHISRNGGEPFSVDSFCWRFCSQLWSIFSFARRYLLIFLRCLFVQ